MATKKNGKRGFLTPYKTYLFRDKDPVIDVLRTAKDSKSLRPRQISQDSGVSTTTIYNWWKGKTRRPQFATVIAVARAMGATQALSNHIERGK